jgi:Xaa-Pro aminopeptidase
MSRTERLKKLRKSLKSLDAFLVTDMNNVRYLTGFTGSSGFVLLTKERGVFATDSRYEEQAAKEVRGRLPGEEFPYEVVVEKNSMFLAVRGLVRKMGIERLGVEASVSYEAFSRFSAYAPQVRAVSGAVQKLRQIKGADELRRIREAVRRAEAAFLEVKPHIRAGVKERAIALRLEDRLRKKGCRRIPFDIIVASGPNSAMPHAGVTERRLSPGDLVTLDWGGEAEGYYSDMTRTLLLRGRDMGRKKEIYSLVLKANGQARAAVAPGAGSREIDGAARDIIKKAGYGNCFGHGLGHGVGLQVHELPRITWSANVTLREGMVVTIEPGVYVSGLGGVRIEDMVAVDKRGAELLTSLPRKLEVI